MKPVISIFVCLGLLFSIFGCATETRLEPASAAMTVDMEKAVNRVQGVKVTADADAWRGNPTITDHVTPIKVTIENGHGDTIRVRYGDLALVGSTGTHYAALPPYKIEGTAETYGIRKPYDIYPAPSFYHRGFRISPPYGSIYPGIPRAQGTFYYDPLYYDRYYRHWQEIHLPTEEMLNSALVEGEIDPGGMVSGFVYFESVGKKEQGVSFTLDLVNVEDGTVFGTATIPFVVE